MMKPITQREWTYVPEYKQELTPICQVAAMAMQALIMAHPDKDPEWVAKGAWHYAKALLENADK